MPNIPRVLEVFDGMGGDPQHVQALVFAVHQECDIAKELARQLIDQAVLQGILVWTPKDNLKRP